MKKPALFLDKDGTLIENVPYNVDPRRMKLMPGVADGLHRLAAEPYLLFVVSNQPGVALGKFTEAALEPVVQALEKIFSAHYCRLAGFYFCPHHENGTVAAYRKSCSCRKPQPGLVTRAATDHPVALSASWFVGDILDDIEAGHRAGCRSALVDHGNETEWRWSRNRRPEIWATHFDRAIEQIIDAPLPRRVA